METKARISSAPSPSLTTDAIPKEGSSESARMIPTEARGYDQAIVQQRQQNAANPNSPPRAPGSLKNQQKIPLTFLGREFTPYPGQARHHPVSPAPVPNPAVEPPLDPESTSPSLGDEPQAPKSPH